MPVGWEIFGAVSELTKTLKTKKKRPEKAIRRPPMDKMVRSEQLARKGRRAPARRNKAHG